MAYRVQIKKLFAAVGIFLAAATGESFPLLGESTTIVENGNADIEIVLPNDVRKEDATAANVLAENLAKLARGGNIKVSYIEKKESARTKIFLKKTECKLGEYFFDGGKISVRAKSGNIEIAYPDETRALNAVGLFLRKFCGMRFYAPSEVGTYYVKRDDFFIENTYREFPDAFALAEIYVPVLDKQRREQVEIWRRLNGLHSMLGGFSHNFSRIFDSEFLDAYPQMKAQKSDGTPNTFAQPDILNPIAAVRAAEKADEFFSKNPRLKIFPMGIDDTSEFDERAETQKLKRGYFRGFPDYSDVVFKFSSDAAEKIARRHPDKFVGVLAYLACENPPTRPIPENLVPFFTTDRANYFDKQYKDQDFRTLEKWGKRAKNFGIYDYAYGVPYFFPREIGKAISEGIAAAHKAGARAYYAELYPVFAYDIKKAAVIFASLENPNGPDIAQKTEDEFYDKFFGAAGKGVRKFFGIAENAWFEKRARRGDALRWLSLFKLESSSEIFDKSDIAGMEAALAEAESAAEDKTIYQKRVNALRVAFDFGKKCDAVYRKKKNLFSLLDKSAVPEKILNALAELDRAELEKTEAFEILKADETYPQRNMDLMFSENFSPKLRTCVYLIKNGVAPEKFENFVPCKTLETALKISADAPNLLGKDGSFEDAQYSENSAVNRRWYPLQFDYDGHYMRIKSAAAHSGKFGLEFAMCENSAISRAVKISEGQAVAFDGFFRGKISAGTACYATIVFFDKSGKILGRESSILPTTDSEKFSEFLAAGVAPQGSAVAVASFFASRMKRGDILQIDDLRLRVF